MDKDEGITIGEDVMSALERLCGEDRFRSMEYFREQKYIIEGILPSPFTPENHLKTFVSSVYTLLKEARKSGKAETQESGTPKTQESGTPKTQESGTPETRKSGTAETDRDFVFLKGWARAHDTRYNQTTAQPADFTPG